MRRRVLSLQSVVLRLVLVHLAPAAMALLVGASGALAQSGTPAPQEQQGKAAPDSKSADAIKENERKAAEFVEAQQALNGPGGNPECVWLGRRVVRLMWLDDLDTAFRHLDLYDRFGCPGGHVQASFRCLTRFGSQIDDKVPRSLNDRIHACWINPGTQPQTAAAPSPAPSSSPTTAGSAAPAAGAAPAQAAPAK
ncbi:beta-1-3, beta-1-6-glucan biosynthesis protein [Bradyrhizobium sp.]|uniref:beta-1-3, beta-1-6-glucan biosynthesis protein n=1 Tax=Bradyrhizobium sp. TaxID=376 RepID=UPI0040380FAD